MRPSGEARFGVLILLGLQLATSAAGVGLVGRMSPAVDRVLMENVFSIEAAEEMLAVLAGGGGVDAFDGALSRARGNVTEAEETEILDEIEQTAGAALDGDPDARGRLSARLRQLGAVNRSSIHRADERIRALGLAGAWAMALLGFASFLLSLVVYRRLETRLLAPVLEVDAVLEAARGGDRYRRCSLAATSSEGGRLSANLNWLLDRRLESGAPRVAAREPGAAEVPPEPPDGVNT